MFSVLDISGKAMSAQSIRLNTTASNLANAESVSSDKDSVYRARNPVFSAVLLDENSQTDLGCCSVKVDGILESNEEPLAQYQPDHPYADKEGYVYSSNINTMEQMANMISASRSYQMSAEVLNTTKQMMQKTLAIGQ